jgi:hypothetical protein
LDYLYGSFFWAKSEKNYFSDNWVKNMAQWHSHDPLLAHGLSHGGNGEVKNAQTTALAGQGRERK